MRPIRLEITTAPPSATTMRVASATPEALVSIASKLRISFLPVYLQATSIGLTRLPRRRGRSARCPGLRLFPLLHHDHSVSLLRETSDYGAIGGHRCGSNRCTNRQHAN